MSLSPQMLLSNISRQKCISKLKEQPAVMFTKVKPVDNASVLVPLCVHNGEVCLLYTVRSSKLRNHSGEVSFPGGKVDLNENHIDTALRETEEEIGIPRDNVDIWTSMPHVQGTNMNMAVTPILGEIKCFDLNMLRRNPDEVEEIFLTPMSSFCDTNNHAHLEYLGRSLPIFIHKKHNIWGITGLITCMFLDSFLPESEFRKNFVRNE